MELLAVLVILILIMSVAVPAVSSSLSKNKEKQVQKNKKLLINASEFYVTDNKSLIYDSLSSDDSKTCYIELTSLVNDNYVDESAVVDEDGKKLTGYVVFNGNDYSFSYSDSTNGYKKCGVNNSQNNTDIGVVTFTTGDYISMTPSSKSNTSSLCGDYELNPQELNLWRVISDNGNNVEMISVYVSSKAISFKGKNSFLKYILCLNQLANAYTSKYTISARNIGYSNQTTELDGNIFSETVPWKCTANNSCNSESTCLNNTDWIRCNTTESLGGGDIGYSSDFEKLIAVFGDVYARKVDDKSKNAKYWLSSRGYKYWNENKYAYRAKVVSDGSNGNWIDATDLYKYENGSFSDGTTNPFGLRPIVTIKNNINCKSGSGKINDPYVLD